MKKYNAVYYDYRNPFRVLGESAPRGIKTKPIDAEDRKQAEERGRAACPPEHRFSHVEPY